MPYERSTTTMCRHCHKAVRRLNSRYCEKCAHFAAKKAKQRARYYRVDPHIQRVMFDPLPVED